MLEERVGLAEGIKYFGIVLQSTNKNKSKVDPGMLYTGNKLVQWRV